MLKKILIIGSTVADIHIFVDHLPSAEEDIHPTGQKMSVGGCAYNVANVLEKQNIPYTLFSPLGTGIYADFIRQNCGKVRPALKSDEENGCCYCLVDASGDRTFMSLHGAEYRFRREWFDELDMQEYDMIYVCGLEIEEPTGKNIISFLRQQKDKFIFYATGPRITHTDLMKNEETMRLADLLHLNRREASAFLHTLGIETADAAEAAGILYQRYGVSSVITDGASPVTLCDKGKISRFDVTPVRQVNGTGAGDSHAGMILAMLARGAKLDEAIPEANRFSAQIVQRDGSV